MANNAVKKVRAGLLELWTRFTPFEKKVGYHLNGQDDDYDNEMLRVVYNSPTAKRAALMMSKYITGDGVSADRVVNERLQLKLSDIVKSAADDVSVQYGAWFHVSYEIKDGKLVTTDPKVLDYERCRKAKKDSQDNTGKIIIKPKTDEGSKKKAVKKGKEKWFYPFSTSEKVTLSQIKADGIKAGLVDASLEDALPHFRGQVYYLNLTPSFTYAVSLFDAVFDDCDTEFRMGRYTNNMSRSGFLGKTGVVTSGLDPEDAAQIDEDVSNWLGSEDAGNVWRLDLDATQDVDKVVKIIQVKSQFDEKQFTGTKKDAKEKILGAANNIPGPLVSKSEGIFGTSGEGYEKLKEFYTEQTSYERNKIESTLNMLGFPCVIIPLVRKKDTEADAEVSEEVIKAQAELRGSVGGVQGILNTQASVSEGKTSVAAAIALLVNVYGFTAEVAADIIGSPKPVDTVALLIEQYKITEDEAKALIAKLIPAT